MQLKETVLALAMCTLCAVGLAGQSPSHGKVSMMFLDARAPGQPPRYSKSEIKKMIQGARTSEDFSRLADYFDYQALEFQEKAQEQLKELEQLLAQSYHARNYATHVEITRDLIRQYRTKARECMARADSYREQMTGSDQMN